jgi:hypothetical protein
MKILLDGHAYEFRPWKPALGRVFQHLFAFDCETTRIDDERPWLTPAYVIGAGFDGHQGYFVLGDDAEGFFAAHERSPIAFHNAAFDLAVLHAFAPHADVYGRVDRDEVWDTQILHRLYVLGSEGHTASGKGESDLEHCAERYLNVQLPKDVVDSQGHPVRVSYAKWLNCPPREIEEVYLEYLGKDVIVTHRVFEALRRLLDQMLARNQGVWGYVSPAWLDEQIRRWGPQTHHIQLRAGIVLKEITKNGLHLDAARQTELAEALGATLESQRRVLRKFGYLPGGCGATKSLQDVLRHQEAGHNGVSFPRTETGLYATAEDALQDLAKTVPFVKLLVEYRTTEKLLNSFVGKMSKRVLHPSFNALVRTGRTSSFGDINAQNLPTDDRVRSCFVPSAGHVFLDADYKTIELATLAQACVRQFCLDSKMASAINAGEDLHTLVAARVKNKPPCEVTDDERKKAKAINFGKPGGMGDATMKEYARCSYDGLRLDDTEVKSLSDAWFDLFPEMRAFLGDSTDTPLELARLLDLTPASHFAHTDDRRFVGHPENAGREDQPHPILGGMLLKVLKTPCPKTKAGTPYSAADVDYFWSRLEARSSLLAAPYQKLVAGRQPSVRLQRQVMGLAGRAGVFTLTGRLRANATYCARHNTVFQGLAADGAKLALWRLWRAGYRIVNFVHDEVLIEVPAESDLKAHAQRVHSLMVEGMRTVVPDIEIGVKFAAADRWYAEAKAVFDKSGRLVLWEPPPVADRPASAPLPQRPASNGGRGRPHPARDPKGFHTRRQAGGRCTGQPRP